MFVKFVKNLLVFATLFAFSMQNLAFAEPRDYNYDSGTSYQTRSIARHPNVNWPSKVYDEGDNITFTSKLPAIAICTNQEIADAQDVDVKSISNSNYDINWNNVSIDRSAKTCTFTGKVIRNKTGGNCDVTIKYQLLVYLYTHDEATARARPNYWEDDPEEGYGLWMTKEREDFSITETGTIKLKAPATPPTSVNIQSFKVFKGDSVTVSADVQPVDADTRAIETWDNSNSNIGINPNIGASASITGKVVGSSNLTATTKGVNSSGNHLSDTVAVEVIDIGANDVSFTYNPAAPNVSQNLSMNAPTNVSISLDNPSGYDLNNYFNYSIDKANGRINYTLKRIKDDPYLTVRMNATYTQNGITTNMPPKLFTVKIVGAETPPPVIPVTSVNIQSFKVFKGDSVTVSADVQPTNADTRAIGTWDNSNSNIGINPNIGASASITGKVVGSSNLTATTKGVNSSGNHLSDTVAVEVIDIGANDVSFTYNPASPNVSQPLFMNAPTNVSISLDNPYGYDLNDYFDFSIDKGNGRINYTLKRIKVNPSLTVRMNATYTQNGITTNMPTKFFSVTVVGLGTPTPAPTPTPTPTASPNPNWEILHAPRPADDPIPAQPAKLYFNHDIKLFNGSEAAVSANLDTPSDYNIRDWSYDTNLFTVSKRWTDTTITGNLTGTGQIKLDARKIVTVTLGYYDVPRYEPTTVVRYREETIKEGYSYVPTVARTVDSFVTMRWGYWLPFDGSPWYWWVTKPVTEWDYWAGQYSSSGSCFMGGQGSTYVINNSFVVYEQGPQVDVPPEKAMVAYDQNAYQEIWDVKYTTYNLVYESEETFNGEVIMPLNLLYSDKAIEESKRVKLWQNKGTKVRPGSWKNSYVQIKTNPTDALTRLSSRLSYGFENTNGLFNTPSTPDTNGNFTITPIPAAFTNTDPEIVENNPNLVITMQNTNATPSTKRLPFYLKFIKYSQVE